MRRQRPAASPSAPAEGPTGIDTPLQFVKGVGPQRAKLLEKLGLT